MKKILLYSVENESKTDSIRRVMELALQNTGLQLEEATAADLKEKLNDDVAILILPGAAAGTSYREQLKGEPIAKIRALTKNGMRLLGTCAGAFVMTEEFEYFDYDAASGHLKEKKHIFSEIAMAKIKAIGPDKRLYPAKQQFNANNPWSVFTTTQVSFQFNGVQVEASLALSKGPSLIALDPEFSKPIAYYVDTDDVALASFSYGQGGGILSGPALEVGGAQLMKHVHPRYHTDTHVSGTVRKLENSHENWSKLWLKVFNELLPSEPRIMKKIARNLGISTFTSKNQKLEHKI